MDDIRVDDDARQVLGKAANELHLVQPPADAKLTLASSLQVYRGSDSRLCVTRTWREVQGLTLVLRACA